MIFGAAPLLLIGIIVEENPLKFHWNTVSIFCPLYLAVIGSALTLFASLLAIAANDCRSTTSDLAHHAAWRSGVRLGDWRRDIFPVVAPWRVLGASWRVDDF
jgi:hypothetical protein